MPRRSDHGSSWPPGACSTSSREPRSQYSAQGAGAHAGCSVRSQGTACDCASCHQLKEASSRATVFCTSFQCPSQVASTSQGTPLGCATRREAKQAADFCAQGAPAQGARHWPRNCMAAEHWQASSACTRAGSAHPQEVDHVRVAQAGKHPRLLRTAAPAQHAPHAAVGGGQGGAR